MNGPYFYILNLSIGTMLCTQKDYNHQFVGGVSLIVKVRKAYSNSDYENIKTVNPAWKKSINI